MMRRAGRGVVVGALLMAPVLACFGDKTIVSTLQSPSTAMGSAVASPLNAVIAVGETLSVTLHAKSIDGTPVTSYDSVLYLYNYPTDTQYISISSQGVVTGKKATFPNNPVQIGIFAFKDGGMAYDAAMVQVTDAVLPGAVLSIQPVPPDSARWQAGMDRRLTPMIYNPTTLDSIQGVSLRLEFRSGDSASVRCQIFPTSSLPSTIAQQALSKNSCTNGVNDYYNALNYFVGLRPDTIWIYANAMVYGTLLRDSLQFIITNPSVGLVYFYPSGLSIGRQEKYLNPSIVPGGTVTFNNYYNPSYGTSFTVTFDNPAAALADPNGSDPTSGNIVGLQASQTATRQFTTSGTYGYTFTITDGVAPFKGITGRGEITVQ